MKKLNRAKGKGLPPHVTDAAGADATQQQQIAALADEIEGRKEAIAATERYKRALVERGGARQQLCLVRHALRDDVRDDAYNRLAHAELECARARAAMLDIEINQMRAYLAVLQQAWERLGVDTGKEPPAAPQEAGSA